MKFEKLFKGKKEAKKPERVLPFDIRYALEHKACVLNKTDLETLAKSNFENEAFYLLLKSLRKNPNKQKALLQKFMTIWAGSDTHQEEVTKDVLRKFITETLEDMNEVKVEGGKLSQLSHQGFDLWQEKLKYLAWELSNDERNIFIVAHTMFIGLPSFIQAFLKKKKTLNILVPEWIENENVGYVITFNENKITVNWLRPPFDNKTGSMVVDDTKNTGKILKQIREFLIKGGSQEPEIQVIAKSL